MANVTQRWPADSDDGSPNPDRQGVDGFGSEGTTEDTAAFVFDGSQDWPLGSTQDEAPRAQTYHRIQDGDEFRALRDRLRRFVFPMTGVFIVWYLLYVVLAAYAPGFMSQRLLGEINIGLVLGLLQFVSTLVITTIYVRFAKRKIDPEVDEIRARAGVIEK